MYFKITLIICMVLLGPYRANAQTNYTPESLQTKMQARITSLNAIVASLESHIELAEEFKKKVNTCAKNDMVYLPKNNNANGKGGVGFKIKDLSGTENTKKNTGCNQGSWHTTKVKIPKDVSSVMTSGNIEVYAGKLDTLELFFLKGEKASVERERSWSDGWGEDHCKGKLSYDGDRTIEFKCRGDDGKNKCKGKFKKLNWTGKELVLE